MKMEHLQFAPTIKLTASVKGEYGLDDFTAIPRGLNGIEERLSLAWEKIVCSEKGNPEMFVSATSSNAAKMANIYPQKGRIEEGSDADLVIWDPNESHTITSKTHNISADFNIFEGEKVSAVASTVLIGGKVIVFERQMNPTNRNGAVVPMSAFPPTLYDAIQDQDASREIIEVKRSIPADTVDAKEASSVEENGTKWRRVWSHHPKRRRWSATRCIKQKSGCIPKTNECARNTQSKRFYVFTFWWIWKRW